MTKKQEKKVPKLRFEGFTDDWQQEKLKNLGRINPTSKIPNNFNYVDLESLNGTKLRYFNYIEKIKAPSRAQRLAKNKDIFYQSVRPYQKNIYLFIEKSEIPFVFSTGYIQYRTSYPQHFLLNYFQTTKFTNEILKRCTGTSYPAINSTDFSNVIIKIPKEKNEAKKIGKMLLALEKSITLNQQYVDKLNTLKRYYLNNLFPIKKLKIPVLRFSGHTTEWQQHKIKELLNYEQPTKYLVKNENYGTSGTPVLTVGKSFILGYTDETDGIYQGNTVIIYDDFTNEHRFIDFPFKVKSSAIKFLTPKSGSNLRFISYLLDTVKIIDEGHKRYYISTTQETKVNVPSLDEQIEIEKIISTIDKMIILNQNNLERIKKLKKQLLNDLFV